MEKSDTNRFSGTATFTYSYRTELLVECPKCGGSAMVNCKNLYFFNEGKLTCKSCNHTEKAKDLKHYNIIVKRNCDNCGKAFEKIIPNSKERANEITIPCPHCGITRTFEPRNEETQLQYNSRGSVCDPILNLQLWLQTEVQGNVFWANNRNQQLCLKRMHVKTEGLNLLALLQIRGYFNLYTCKGVFDTSAVFEINFRVL